MDTNIKNQKSKFLWLALLPAFLISITAKATDDPAIQQSETAEHSTPVVSEAQTGTSDKPPAVEVAAKPGNTDSEPLFPRLERALIIATITNFVIIIFAISLYIVKRRMMRFNPAPLARNRMQE